jgi:hypothetical protein
VHGGVKKRKKKTSSKEKFESHSFKTLKSIVILKRFSCGFGQKLVQNKPKPLPCFEPLAKSS